MSDLTTAEQASVRAGVRFLRVRIGNWKTLGKVLRIHHITLARVAGGTFPVSASLAVRVARLAKVGVDDVLNGKYPPAGTCAHCGHTTSDTAE